MPRLSTCWERSLSGHFACLEIQWDSAALRVAGTTEHHVWWLLLPALTPLVPSALPEITCHTSHPDSESSQHQGTPEKQVPSLLAASLCS